MNETETAYFTPFISHGLLIAPPQTNASIDQPSEATSTFILDITYTSALPAPSTPPIWSQQNIPSGSSTIINLYQENSGWRLDINCQGSGVFLFKPSGIKAYWQPEGTNIMHYFLGIGLAIWFELRNIPCFHGNSIVSNGNAFALLGASQSGKSTLATTLIHGGASFLTDDLIIPQQTNGDWLVYPAPGPLRMWPSSLQLFQESNLDLASFERVHAGYEKRQVPIEAGLQGKICKTTKSLKAIYILNRDRSKKRTPIKIEKLRPTEALLALISNSISGETLKPLGVEKSRLAVLGQIISDIPVKRISYPSGSQYLTSVQDILTTDFLTYC